MLDKNAKLSVTLFGGFVVECEGVVLSSLSPRANSIWRLFRYLLANSGRFVTFDNLIDVLWGDDDVVNPRKALQNLIYRLRKQLPETDENGQPYILSQHRNYGWNADALVYVDAFEFDEIANSIKSGLDDKALVAANRRLMELYSGDYMEDLASESWVESLTSHYRRLYFDCVNSYTTMLYEQGDYAEVVEICSTVLKHNLFEEHYHALLINALLAQGNRYSALVHYRNITSMLQKELNVEPSAELRAAGRSINTVSQPTRPDINMVIDDLRSVSAAAGPMFCEMDVFRQMFQLHERMNRREEYPSMLVMYTIVAHSRQLNDQEMFHVMASLKRACMISLRRTDIVTQHSNMQLLMLLPNVSEVSISIVLMRIQQKFAQLCMESGVMLTTQVRSLIRPKID
ncbi:winged helix-turn-helix domain-containing protein [Christensenellaceae bacterium OttesenSCG-928-L17]|nr:winged helix-turn-helix domain-containing protein [Christensenellaceae bacterium OttesenSCG-928-L17]